YYCFCTKEKVEEIKENQNLGAKYNDPCRYIPPDEAKERVKRGEPYVVRQRIPEIGATSFEDAVFGKITVDNNTLDENVLLKSDGFPTYNFANVIDD
ncbi:MAG TPA: glutamate--tRNA ligase, partial [Clostridiaceae bacterium]|nr:glutamate--tRNA ligase [Clostridiaceae bacterium]